MHTERDPVSWHLKKPARNATKAALFLESNLVFHMHEEHSKHQVHVFSNKKSSHLLQLQKGLF